MSLVAGEIDFIKEKPCHESYDKYMVSHTGWPKDLQLLEMF